MLILGVARLDSNKEKRQLRIGAVHTREAQKKRENIYKKKDAGERSITRLATNYW